MVSQFRGKAVKPEDIFWLPGDEVARQEKGKALVVDAAMWKKIKEVHLKKKTV